ncbi:DoxX family protein [Peredibacter sp. HCB2-198]|uniref:DoxX family protein n=1 Tax=Peredibacter sp. HCB2-198 TaxID=3383025 RepID=UPI0038B42C34
MNTTQKDDLAKLFLRVVVGGLMLFHGMHKIVHGYGHVGGMLNQAGLPEFIQHGVLVGEILAPLLLIIGYKTRYSAILIIFTMLVAVGLAYHEKIFTLNQYGGWMIELHVFFIVSSLAIILLGAGKYALESSGVK